MKSDLEKLKRHLGLYLKATQILEKRPTSYPFICTGTDLYINNLMRFISEQEDLSLKEMIDDYNKCDRTNFSASNNSINDFIKKYNAKRGRIYEIRVQYDEQDKVLHSWHTEYLIEVDNSREGNLLVIEKSSSPLLPTYYILPNTNLLGVYDISNCFRGCGFKYNPKVNPINIYFTDSLSSIFSEDKPVLVPWYVIRAATASHRDVQHPAVQDQMKKNDVRIDPYHRTGLIFTEDIPSYTQYNIKYIKNAFDNYLVDLNELREKHRSKEKRLEGLINSVRKLYYLSKGA